MQGNVRTDFAGLTSNNKLTPRILALASDIQNIIEIHSVVSEM
jgi:hypothetical protein